MPALKSVSFSIKAHWVYLTLGPVMKGAGSDKVVLSNRLANEKVLPAYPFPPAGSALS
jgi:hypothetical protein